MLLQNNSGTACTYAGVAQLRVWDSRCVIRMKTSLLLWIHLSKLKEAKIVSLPPSTWWHCLRESVSLHPARWKKKPWPGGSSFCPSHRLAATWIFVLAAWGCVMVTKWDSNQQASGGRSWEGAALEQVKSKGVSFLRKRSEQLAWFKKIWLLSSN